MKVLDWIAGKLGYVTREYERTRIGGDAVARGERWQQFYTEDGGLADMLRAMRFELFEQWADKPLDDHASRDRLALKDESIRDLGDRVRTVIETGKIRAAAQAAADKATIR